MAPKPIRLLVEGDFITDEERELVIQISRLTSRSGDFRGLGRTVVEEVV